MAKRNEAVTADELHKLAADIEDWGMTANAVADRMQKALSKDLGDELELLSRLAGAAESILGLHRQVMGAARMLKSNRELEEKLRARQKGAA